MNSEFLSATDRQKGLSRYLLYVFINGLGYSFLSETIIYLMALHFEASNVQLGYIASILHVTGVVVLLVPVLFAGRRIVNLFFTAWLLRGLICVGYIGVLFVANAEAVWIIMAVYTGYCILRNIAWPMNLSLRSALIKPREAGRVTSSANIVLNYSILLSRVVSFVVLSIGYLSSLVAIFIIEGLGIVLNTGSAVIMQRIPVRDRVEKKSLGGMLSFFSQVLRTSNLRIIAFLYVSCIGLLVMQGFLVGFYKSEVGLGNNEIFVFAIGVSISMIMASSFVKPFFDKVGSRPILALAYACLLVLSVGWVLLPPATHVVLLFLLGFATGFVTGLVRILIERLIIKNTRPTEKVSFVAVINFLSAMAALAVGLLGGYLADYSSLHGTALTHDFSYTFLVFSFIGITNFLATLVLRDEGSFAIPALLRILFSWPNLSVFYKLVKYEKQRDEVSKQKIILEIEANRTHLATNEIRRHLHQPMMREKEMTIRSLFSNPRPELKGMLIDEARDVDSWWRQSAIFALGAYPGKDTEDVLLEAMTDRYPYIRSVAAKSLARIGNADIYGKILDDLKRPTLAPRTRLNFIMAISILDKEGAYLENVFTLAEEARGHRFCQSVFIIVSERLSFRPGVQYFFYHENEHPGEGMALLLDEAKDVRAIFERMDHLGALVAEGNYRQMWHVARDLLAGRHYPAPYHHLQNAIATASGGLDNPTHTLAMMYYMYNLVELSDTIEQAIRQQKDKPT